MRRQVGVRPALLALTAAAGLLAACATPAAGTLAREAASVVEDRLGVAPRWRGGDAPSPADEARVRTLLAGPLDERGAVEVALVRSRRVQASLERAIGAAFAAHAEAAPSNPVLDFLVRWPHGGGGPIVDAGLTLGLLDVLRSPGRSDAAALAARGAALEAAEEIVGAVAEVREAWIEAVAARQREALDADAAEAASITADLADRQRAAGTLARIDVLRFRAFADEAFVTLARARTDTRIAAERLVRALGLVGDEVPVAVAGELPPPPAAAPEPDDAERRAVARRIDLERARLAVAEARLAAGLAAGERAVPELDAGVTSERGSDGARSTGPSFSFELPLSPKDPALAQAARARAREAEDRLSEAAVRVRSEAREAATALGGASSVAERYRGSIVPARAATVEEAQLRYNGMLLGVHDLLAEKREELRARRDLVDVVRDAWIARIRLDVALGGEPSPPATAAIPRDAESRPVPDDSRVPHRHGGH